MWSDIFYPDNPKRREKLIRKTQELQDLMNNNFRATNQLIDVMNKHLSCSFEHIALDENDTLQVNCNVMIACMHKLQAEVERIDKKLKEKLEPHLYEKLLNMSLSTEDVKRNSNIFLGLLGIATLTSTILAGCLIKNGAMFGSMTSVFLKIGAGTLATVVLAVVFMGIDMIVSAILGSIERDKLNEALKEFDKALGEFRPASEKYQDDIAYVKVRIDIMEEAKNPSSK